MEYILENGTVFLNNEFQKLDIHIKDTKILRISEKINENITKINCKNLLITLGFVDMHVHLREPGNEHKETIKTGSLAALYGGFTHIVAMPNTSPVMDNLETINDFAKRVEKTAYVNTFTYSALTYGLKGIELVNIEKIKNHPIILGFSDDGKGIQKKEIMNEAMQKKIFITAHCEDETLLKAFGSVHEGKVSKRLNEVGICSASEYMQVKRDLQLAKIHNANYHVCHVSTKETVALIKEFQNEGLNVSGEITPHHLLLNENDVKNDTNYKMNPPLRSKKDQEALLNALNTDVLNIIATDHAPHSLQEKQTPMKVAPFGIIGSEFAFSLLYTKLVKNNKLQLKTLLNALSTNPAKRLNLQHEIKENEIANLTIINLEKTKKITKESLHSKSINTPFLNEEVFGIPVYTIINGKIFDLSL